MKVVTLLLALLVSVPVLAQSPALQITMTPLFSDGQLTAVSIEQHYSGLQGKQPLWSVSQTVGPLQNIAARIHGLSLRDSQGNVPLLDTQQTPVVLEVSNPQSWQTGRAINGEVTLRYTADVSEDTNTGPTWELRSQATGVSGAGIAFLVLPDLDTDLKVTSNWVLSAFPYPASQIDSLPAAPAISLNRVLMSYFMAGNLATTPASAAPFYAASLQSFNAISNTELLNWSAASYKQLNRLFNTAGQQPFTVLFRDNPLIMQSGTALPDALMVAAKAENTQSKLKQILMHEMVHVFLHGLADESWFQEGLAIYYQDRAAFLLGMLTVTEYAERMNNTLLKYYSNVQKHMTMSDATAAFWTDARARLQPYNRGAMYFMITDGRIRTATNGKRNLDHVLNQFLTMHRRGESVTKDDWLTLLQSIIGEQAYADYNAMQQGDMLIPDNNALGECFALTKTTTPVFELGFDIASLMQSPRIIRGLKAGSPAAKAGLKEHDVVLNTLSLDARQATPQAPIQLVVQRGNAEQTISFVPAGPQTTSYAWQVRGHNEEQSCH
ncbi:hypothetical protein [Alteromonas gilva]|uniref:Peptidase M61 catalytic domain-containing protein n=1 Tax=Alteromonas gilva TaxID=2987522 RepID=A0ABT5L4D8_9ALTE|nr:hypothetical protein [Alteromonas gilva]MDC8831900.1 hypothetical protein [Alteromonas gilva]